MKTKTHSNPIASLAYLFGLMLLLLLSPCKVRNSLQLALDIPQTEVTNKSQTTVNSCNNLLEKESSYTFSTLDKTNKQICCFAVGFVPQNTVLLRVLNSVYPDENEENNSSIPYYILYKNAKIFE